LVLLAYQLNSFISEILVNPDLLAVVAFPEIIETFKDIIELKSDEPVYLVYDTTFNLGDCCQNMNQTFLDILQLPISLNDIVLKVKQIC
jgi:hypothetical protein